MKFREAFYSIVLSFIGFVWSNMVWFPVLFGGTPVPSLREFFLPVTGILFFPVLLITPLVLLAGRSPKNKLVLLSLYSSPVIVSLYFFIRMFVLKT
jgi:hypothetical protein